MLKAVALGLGGFVLVMVGLFAVMSSLAPDFESPAPTDEILDANFRAHRKVMDSLLEMSRADRSVVRIAHDFTWLDTDYSWPRPIEKLGFSKERFDQYRRLFREAGLQNGILKEEGGEVTYFIYWSRGLMTNASYKGYAYSETALTPIVSSLDHYESWPKGKRVIFKKLDDNWYLVWMSS